MLGNGKHSEAIYSTREESSDWIRIKTLNYQVDQEVDNVYSKAYENTFEEIGYI